MTWFDGAHSPWEFHSTTVMISTTRSSQERLYQHHHLPCGGLEDQLTLQGSLHAGFASGSKAKQSGTANAHSFGTEAEGLDNIGTSLDSTVDPDFDLVKHFRAILSDLEQDMNRR
ncbi:uncharacterized protein TrAtP1_007869 [Trichoderma atroviride]|uniref:uncharacterized protein n=1 Tax=Hypocrea atroviridis TaxID=63577 RepID=UPI00332E11D2|nr:hypothetical protein TrAtP1_007869 [Trichoderma atroviride]